MKYGWVEAPFKWPIVHWLVALAFMTKGSLLQLCGFRYRAISDFCWLVRVSRARPFQQFARTIIDKIIADMLSSGKNSLVDFYLESSLSVRCAASYSLAGSGQNDLFRDLIVLKAATSDEKGVILLKYARTFEAVVALLDFSRLLKRYTFVLEPCWAGYCDPALLLFFSPGNPVVVQCFTDEDYAFIESIGPPLMPVRLGPADWVNSDIFRDTSPQPRRYDLVMVANWGAHKRHAQLFRALRRISERNICVLLVGFPWAGRTCADVQREVRKLASTTIDVEIVENITQTELAHYLSQCKVQVFLSKKEGDNKALVEAMFADIPAIVYDGTVGGARSRINPATGIFSSDDELADKIRYMLDHRTAFSPRAWALENTGSTIATRIIDEALGRVATRSGAQYERHIVEKFNAPNLAYRDAANRSAFRPEYDFITSCLRPRPVT